MNPKIELRKKIENLLIEIESNNNQIKSQTSADFNYANYARVRGQIGFSISKIDEAIRLMQGQDMDEQVNQLVEAKKNIETEFNKMPSLGAFFLVRFVNVVTAGFGLARTVNNYKANLESINKTISSDSTSSVFKILQNAVASIISTMHKSSKTAGADDNADKVPLAPPISVESAVIPDAPDMGVPLAPSLPKVKAPEVISEQRPGPRKDVLANLPKKPSPMDELLKAIRSQDAKSLLNKNPSSFKPAPKENELARQMRERRKQIETDDDETGMDTKNNNTSATHPANNTTLNENYQYISDLQKGFTALVSMTSHNKTDKADFFEKMFDKVKSFFKSGNENSKKIQDLKVKSEELLNEINTLDNNILALNNSTNKTLEEKLDELQEVQKKTGDTFSKKLNTSKEAFQNLKAAICFTDAKQPVSADDLYKATNIIKITKDILVKLMIDSNKPTLTNSDIKKFQAYPNISDKDKAMVESLKDNFETRVEILKEKGIDVLSIVPNPFDKNQNSLTNGVFNTNIASLENDLSNVNEIQSKILTTETNAINLNSKTNLASRDLIMRIEQSSESTNSKSKPSDDWD